MLAGVGGHVDHLGCGPCCSHGRFDDWCRFTGEGDDSAVGGLAGIDVEELHSVHGLDLVGDLADDVQVAALAEVGNALDQPGHAVSSSR